MKSDFYFHSYSRIIIIAILAISIILIQKSVRSRAEFSPADYPYNIAGWAWNAQKDIINDAIGIGWVSLNCDNDFDTPGEYQDKCDNANFQWPTKASDYGLKVEEGTGNITGCAWSGNNLSGGTSPLGWICFSDMWPGVGPEYGVATSTTYLNALDPNTFASILNREDWRCVGTTGGVRDGLKCPPDGVYCSSFGGTCELTTPDNEAWKLGFPILYSADGDADAPAIGAPGASYSPSPGGDIGGCFNCYEQENYVCSRETYRQCGAAFPPCPLYDDGGNLVPQDCIVGSIDYLCENCLEYQYYDGRCELPGEIPGTPATYGTHNDCRSNEDCDIETTTEICQPVSTCKIHAPGLNSIQEFDCKDTACPLGGALCIEREIGSLKELIGAYNCSECNVESYANTCGVNSYEGNLNSCGMCENTFFTPGVMLDHNYYNISNSTDFRAYMCGWGWNAWDDGLGNIDGLEWFQFGPRVSTTTRAYIYVDRGNIYSQKSISNPYAPPFGYSNASYLIESGGSITNFVSSSTLAGDYQGEVTYRPIIDFPTIDANYKYTNALGTIDYFGLTRDFDGLANGVTINKYGATVSTPPLSGAGSIAFNNAASPGDKVYYYEGPFTMNSSYTGLAAYAIRAGSGTDNSALVVVIDGDFEIGDDILYETSASYDNLKNIPSMVWVIRGDLLIDADVNELAGTFIVLGDGTSCAFTPPALPSPGCGQVVTCTGSGTAVTCDDRPLVINGNIMARYFDLGRTFVGLDPVTGDRVPSEQFINDGRLQANPPAGFEDFSKLIPRFTDI